MALAAEPLPLNSLPSLKKRRWRTQVQISGAQALPIATQSSARVAMSSGANRVEPECSGRERNSECCVSTGPAELCSREPYTRRGQPWERRGLYSTEQPHRQGVPGHVDRIPEGGAGTSKGSSVNEVKRCLYSMAATIRH